MSTTILSDVNAMAIPAKNLFVPSELGNIHVKYKDHDFFVIDEKNHEFAVERGDLSKELRGISQEQLNKYLDSAYLALKKSGEDYSIQLNPRLKGGGWISGSIGKLITYGVGFGTIIIGAGAVTITSPAIGIVLVVTGTTTNAINKFSAIISQVAEKVDQGLTSVSILP